MFEGIRKIKEHWLSFMPLYSIYTKDETISQLLEVLSSSLLFVGNGKCDWVQCFLKTISQENYLYANHSAFRYKTVDPHLRMKQDFPFAKTMPSVKVCLTYFSRIFNNAFYQFTWDKLPQAICNLKLLCRKG